MEGQIKLEDRIDRILTLTYMYNLLSDEGIANSVTAVLRSRIGIHIMAGDEAYWAGPSPSYPGAIQNMEDIARDIEDPKLKKKFSTVQIHYAYRIVTDGSHGPNIRKGQELVYHMTDQLKEAIPRDLYDKVMSDMQEHGNCGIWSCCMLCVEELVERWKEDTKDV